MALSADEVPLNINSHENPAVISVVNKPKFKISYSPLLATLIHNVFAIFKVTVAPLQNKSPFYFMIIFLLMVIFSEITFTIYTAVL